MEVIEYNHMYQCHILSVLCYLSDTNTDTTLRQDIGVNIRILK